MLSAGAESMIVLAPPAASMILSAPFDCVSTLSTITLTAMRRAGGNKKTTMIGNTDNRGAADWSATKDGRVLPHFQQIVSGALMSPCPIVAVF